MDIENKNENINTTDELYILNYEYSETYYSKIAPWISFKTLLIQ